MLFWSLFNLCICTHIDWKQTALCHTTTTNNVGNKTTCDICNSKIARKQRKAKERKGVRSLTSEGSAEATEETISEEASAADGGNASSEGINGSVWHSSTCVQKKLDRLLCSYHIHTHHHHHRCSTSQIFSYARPHDLYFDILTLNLFWSTDIVYVWSWFAFFKSVVFIQNTS